jgi:eukaryotic-like serine/threonine-protein kinase
VAANPVRLGPYEIVAKIAKGGMATVFLGRARAANGRMRIVAVKAIRPELSQDAEFVTMFLDEAKILSRLDHGNIARTLEFGTEGSLQFIAMELLLGRTVLEAWDACVARALPLRFDLAAWICARVADGLHYAHELCDADGIWLNIVHRDVNPSNIFLTYDGQVKLFDFGLARAKGKRHKTQSGIVKGKVAYLSPEQLLQLPIDRRCDVFSLGATLWELTTMRRLFKKDQDVATAMAIQDAKVPDPRTLVPDYPDRLWEIVRRALAKDRNDRYQRAQDLARDLDAFVGKAALAKMGELSGRVLDDLFPGDRDKQMGWLKTTSAMDASKAKATIAPPALLPSVNIPTKTEREAAKIMSQYVPGPKSRR